MKSAAVLMLLVLTMTAGCAHIKTLVGVTDASVDGASIAAPSGPTAGALCRAWGESLPTRSRSDTEVTKSEIEAGYAAFAGACPDHDHLIP